MTYNPSSYGSVVRITDTIGSLSWQGSGVLISPDEVLTASHVVYTQGLGSATNIQVATGGDYGASSYEASTGAYLHYNEVDDSNGAITNQQSQFDYAVIHLLTPFFFAGSMGIETDFAGGLVDITGYPASAGGSQVTSTQFVTRDPSYTLLDGISLGPGSSGGPVWTTVNGKSVVVGLVSSEQAVSGVGYNTLITTSALNQIDAWVAEDDANEDSASTLAVDDTSSSRTVSVPAQSYSGPVAEIRQQFVAITSDSLNIKASSPSWFIHGGLGDDAIAVSSGTNVLDGGKGSNFLTGGTGTDTFFVDARGPADATWSTINGFHSGDEVTVWGITPSSFILDWADGQGAAGYKGLTLNLTGLAKPTSSVTLVGFTRADLADNRLSVSFGTDPSSASPYMSIHTSH